MAGTRRLVAPTRVTAGRRTPGVLLAGAVLLVLAVVTLALLTRPGGRSAAGLPAAAPAASVTTNSTPLAPQRVVIPSLGVDASLTGLGRTADGGWDVPPVTTPELASWYSDGVTPGQVGPAVILGHVSGRPAGATRSIPGVFAKLDKIEVGARVQVAGAGGASAQFEVTRVEHVKKAAFPTGEVLGGTPGPELRLITCGGTLRTLPDGSHSYDGSVIVFARGV